MLRYECFNQQTVAPPAHNAPNPTLCAPRPPRAARRRRFTWNFLVSIVWPAALHQHAQHATKPSLQYRALHRSQPTPRAPLTPRSHHLPFSRPWRGQTAATQVSQRICGFGGLVTSIQFKLTRRCATNHRAGPHSWSQSVCFYTRRNQRAPAAAMRVTIGLIVLLGICARTAVAIQSPECPGGCIIGACVPPRVMSPGPVLCVACSGCIVACSARQQHVVTATQAHNGSTPPHSAHMRCSDEREPVAVRLRGTAKA